MTESVKILKVVVKQFDFHPPARHEAFIKHLQTKHHMSSFIFPYHYYRSSCPARQSKAACIWSDRYSFREGWIHFLHLFQWIFEALWRSCVWPLIVVVPEHESRMCGRGVCREWCHHPTEQKQTPLRSYDTKSISTHYLQFHTATAAAAAITWSATVTTVCLQPEMLQYITTDK